jgi:hypothetical protein
MRVRRALAIAITTPVLLATIGTTGAPAAATPHESTTQAHQPGDAEEDEDAKDDEMTPEDAAAYSFAYGLFNRFASREGAKMQTRTLDKSGTNQL